MRFTLRALVVAVLTATGLPVSAVAQESAPRLLHLEFHPDGTVTLAARNVTARDVLSEWARQCGCYIVNADRLTGAPMAVPVLFENAPQATVLHSLLKGAAGYVLTPRRAGASGPSNFETIYVVATSSSSPPAPSYVQSAPAYTPVSVSTPGSPDDEIPAVMPSASEDVAAERPDPAGEKTVSPVLPGMTVPAVRIVPVFPGGVSSQNPATPAAPEPGKPTPIPPAARPGTSN